MLRHSALCRNSRARHRVASRMCTYDKDALSRQCGVVLRRDIEDHVRQTKPGSHDKAGAPRLGPHDRGIILRQRFLCCDRLCTMVKKIKKKPWDWGVTA